MNDELRKAAQGVIAQWKVGSFGMGKTLEKLESALSKNANAAPQDQDAKCEWTIDDDDNGKTLVSSCDEEYPFFYYTQRITPWVKHCPGCGKPVKFIDAAMDGDKNAG